MIPGGQLPARDRSSPPAIAAGDLRRRLVVNLRELVMILELHREGLSISAIAEQTGKDRKTIRKYIRNGRWCRAIRRGRRGCA